ncbi:MAG: hypothetical protein HWN81_01545 [Candidatus Lokiarchaeota archaeon]|nr:hypothetical protein [Candidatus Lokiarchaeota archaeon]
MGLEVINKKIYEVIDEINVYEDFSNISNLIIPFSIMFKKKAHPDIYTGEESISFQEKDSEFRQILIHEFLIK